MKTPQGFSPISFCGGNLDGANLVVITADAVHGGQGGVGEEGSGGSIERIVLWPLITVKT